MAVVTAMMAVDRVLAVGSDNDRPRQRRECGGCCEANLGVMTVGSCATTWGADLDSMMEVVAPLVAKVGEGRKWH
ncbi:putative basic proline-rich protein-like [Iris pallida]|uniref:Basic proline-rich protein-like n=1 Tax=Iris pallida TaxID=29817 RepID=A0AAX6E8H3_IRIPA|nr:putative basic proline-rich protein-like [Iris pallida]